MNDRRFRARMGIGLTLIAFVLLLVPLLLNTIRGGVGGVGVDPRTEGSDLRFAITYAESAALGPLTGHLVLVVAREEEPEPRFQVSPGAREPYAFRRDVRAWRPGRPVELTDSDPGIPLPSLAHIQTGHYWVQAVFESEDPSSGASPRSFEDELAGDWSRRPGNLVSRPVFVFIDPRSDDIIRVYLARRIQDAAQSSP